MDGWGLIEDGKMEVTADQKKEKSATFDLIYLISRISGEY